MTLTFEPNNVLIKAMKSSKFTNADLETCYPYSYEIDVCLEGTQIEGTHFYLYMQSYANFEFEPFD